AGQAKGSRGARPPDAGGIPRAASTHRHAPTGIQLAVEITYTNRSIADRVPDAHLNTSPPQSARMHPSHSTDASRSGRLRDARRIVNSERHCNDAAIASKAA